VVHHLAKLTMIPRRKTAARVVTAPRHDRHALRFVLCFLNHRTPENTYKCLSDGNPDKKGDKMINLDRAI
jgi:hypothetical protein